MRLAISSLILAAGLATAAHAQEPAAATPPTLPTTGDGATVLSVVEKVCVPLVRGGSLEALAKPLGMRLNRREGTWSMQLGSSRAHQIIVFPTGSNKDVCNVEIRHPVGQDEPITSALNVWSFVQQPPLEPTANYTQPQDPDGLKRVRRSWEALTANSSTGLNISTVTKPDGSPVNRNYGLATMQYQERKF